MPFFADALAWGGDVHTDQSSPVDLEVDGKLQEALQAEQVAEQLAQEATRTRPQAKQATAALHRDHGFGTGKAKTICGGDHYARDCPDRRPGTNPTSSWTRTMRTSTVWQEPHAEERQGKFAHFMDDGYGAMYVKGKCRPWHTGQGYGQQPTSCQLLRLGAARPGYASKQPEELALHHSFHLSRF